MPRKRQPKEIWQETRCKVWERDNHCCQSPLQPPLCIGKPFIALNKCHIDHIKSGKNAGNELENLRTLCPVCHVLRVDFRHRGMIARALEKGLIPADWRKLVWE